MMPYVHEGTWIFHYFASTRWEPQSWRRNNGARHSNDFLPPLTVHFCCCGDMGVLQVVSEKVSTLILVEGALLDEGQWSFHKLILHASSSDASIQVRPIESRQVRVTLWVKLFWYGSKILTVATLNYWKSPLDDWWRLMGYYTPRSAHFLALWQKWPKTCNTHK